MTAGSGVHDSDFATYFRPHPGGTIIVGSFEPECDPQIFLEDAEDARPSPSAENWEVQRFGLLDDCQGCQVPSQKSGIVAHTTSRTTGFPSTTDNSSGGYYVAIGTSGHQFKAAPFAVSRWPNSSTRSSSADTTTTTTH